MDSREKVSGLLLALAIFFISFGSFGSFVDNFNQSIFVLLISIPVLYLYRDKIKLGYSFFWLLIISSIMCWVSMVSNLPDEGRVWGRFISIICIFVFSFTSYLYLSNKNKYFLVLSLISLFGLLHFLLLMNGLIINLMVKNYNILESLTFFGHIRHYSAFLSICFLTSYVLSFFSKKFKKLFVVNSILLLFFLLFLGTRSSYLSLFFVIIVLSIYMYCFKIKFFFKSLFIFLSAFILQLMFGSSSHSLGFFNSINRTVSGNVSSGRVLIWKETWKYIEKNFWGYGGDAFLQLNIGMKALGGVFVQAHNAFFQIVLEWGVIVFIMLVIYFLILSYKCFYWFRDKYVFTIYLMILNILIISIFDGVFYYIFELFFLILFISLLNARLNFLSTAKEAFFTKSI